MKEELTTKMHSEFFGNEFTEDEWKAMDIAGAQSRGMPLQEALAKYGLSEERFKAIYAGLSL